MKSRLDQFLVQQGHTKSRSQAQLLIKEGKVFVNKKIVQKTGCLIDEQDEVVLETKERYVGRGALKIKAAIEKFGISVEGKIIADCGASTGGFTDYLLKQGAKKSYCIDVGHDQLDPSLKNDDRVINMEGVNLKESLELPEKVDLVVADLSFISLRLALPTMRSFLKKEGEMILLFKPQFEVGRENIHKNGLVKDEKIRQKALQEFKQWCEEKSLFIKGRIDSPILGKQGNKEYLLYIR